MAVRFQGGRAVPAAGNDKMVERRALNSAISKMQQMKALAESLRADFNVSTSGGPLWKQVGFEEIPATINGYIPDLIDREIRRAQSLMR